MSKKKLLFIILLAILIVLNIYFFIIYIQNFIANYENYIFIKNHVSEFAENSLQIKVLNDFYKQIIRFVLYIIFTVSNTAVYVLGIIKYSRK